jgi:hypothetical protein
MGSPTRNHVQYALTISSAATVSPADQYSIYLCVDPLRDTAHLIKDDGFRNNVWTPLLRRAQPWYRKPHTRARRTPRC